MVQARPEGPKTPEAARPEGPKAPEAARPERAEAPSPGRCPGRALKKSLHGLC